MELVETPQPIDGSATAPVDTDTETLADHEAAFGPTRQQPSADAEEEGAEPERPRHRAKSQKATADDVAEINALTKDLRAKEAELAKAKPEALAGSPRLLALKRQIRAIEGELAELAPKPVAHAEPATPAPVAAAAPVALRAKPTEEDVAAGKYASYADFVEDLADWKSEQRAAARQQAAAEAQAKQAAQDAQANWTQIEERYAANVQAFAQQTPDFDQKLEVLKDFPPATPIMLTVLKSDPNGPRLVYTLAQQLGLWTELHLITDGKPVTDQSVALTRRWLTSRLQAATTGSAGSTPLPPRQVFRPPNPVRPGPSQPSDDLPGDEGSLADHEKAFGPKRRR